MSKIYSARQWRRRLAIQLFLRRFSSGLAHGLGNATAWVIVLWWSYAWWHAIVIELANWIARHVRIVP